MKQLVLNIKEKQFSAFLKFIKTLDYVTVAGENEMPAWQVEETKRRIKALEEGTDTLMNWDEVQSDLFKRDK